MAEQRFYEICDAEDLRHETEHDALEAWWDQCYGDIPETIDIGVYERVAIEESWKDGRADAALETLLEWIEEEYGDPDGYVEIIDEKHKPAIKAAAKAFVEAVTAFVEPWQCRQVDTITRNVAEWLEERGK